jgi:DNA polymerase-3 subunit epsilon
MDFVVIDVETANNEASSICQVGIASFRDGQLAESWVSLVNPEVDFNPFNVIIHGIRQAHVQSAPTWIEVFPEIASRLQGRIVVSHTSFDQRALGGACARSRIPECVCTWLDSTRVVRIAWPQFAKAGFGLPNVAAHFGIDYRAHDALEDARCAGLLVLRAMDETGLSLSQWLVRVQQPITPPERSLERSKWPAPCKRAGAVNGPLFGEVVVFTGSLATAREQAADTAAAAGCRVDGGVTKQTTILVVGERDSGFGNHAKSAKSVKAEQLIRKGQRIRILGEGVFLRMVQASAALAVNSAS